MCRLTCSLSLTPYLSSKWSAPANEPRASAEPLQSRRFSLGLGDRILLQKPLPFCDFGRIILFNSKRVAICLESESSTRGEVLGLKKRAWGSNSEKWSAPATKTRAPAEALECRRCCLR